MNSQISLTGLLVAAMMFAVTVAMHQASRADDLVSQGVTPVAERLVTNHASSSGGSSHI